MSAHYVYIPLGRGIIVTSFLLVCMVFFITTITALIANGMGMHVLHAVIAAATVVLVIELLDKLFEMLRVTWDEEARTGGREVGGRDDSDSEDEEDESDSD